jgi:hypothetical protein
MTQLRHQPVVALLSVVLSLVLVGCNSRKGPSQPTEKSPQAEVSSQTFAPPSSTVITPKDLLALQIQSGDIELGVRYRMSGSSTQSSESSNEYSVKRSLENTHYQEDSFRRTIKLKLSAALRASAGSTGTSYSGSLSSRFDYETTSSYFDKSTYDQRDKQTTEVKDLLKKKKEATIAYGPQDGFIRTRLVITNSTPDEVIVQNVSYDMVETSSCSGGVSATNSLGSGKISTADLQQGNAQGGQGQVISKGAEPLVVKVPGNSNYSQQLYFPSLDTNFVMDAMQRHNPIELKINSFDVSVKGRNQLVTNNVKPTDRVELDLVTPDGNTSIFFVKPDLWDFGGLTLKSTLKKVANVSFDTYEGKPVIKEINGKNSDFYGVNTTNDSDRGMWVVASSKIGWRDLDEKVPNGTKFVVIWMYKRELAAPKQFKVTIPVLKAFTPLPLLAHEAAVKRYSENSGFVPLACIGTVRQGDTIRIRLSGSKKTYTQAKEEVDCGFGKVGPQSTKNWAEENTEPLNGADGLEVFKIFISLDVDSAQRVLVPLAAVVPACGYVSYPDGRVELEFVVDDRLLPEGQGELCFVSPLSPAKKIYVGRWADRQSFCYGEWYLKDPGGLQDYFDHNQLTLEGQVLRVQ